MLCRISCLEFSCLSACLSVCPGLFQPAGGTSLPAGIPPVPLLSEVLWLNVSSPCGPHYPQAPGAADESRAAVGTAWPEVNALCLQLLSCGWESDRKDGGRRQEETRRPFSRVPLEALLLVKLQNLQQLLIGPIQPPESTWGRKDPRPAPDSPPAPIPTCPSHGFSSMTRWANGNQNPWGPNEEWKLKINQSGASWAEVLVVQNQISSDDSEEPKTVLRKWIFPSERLSEVLLGSDYWLTGRTVGLKL